MNKILAFLAIAGLIGGFLFYRYKVAPQIEIPEISIINQDGDTVLLSSLHQGPMLLNYYASWCGPCMQEMPNLQKASEMNSKFTVIGLTDDTPDKIVKVKSHFGITFPIYQLSKSLDDYGVYTIPTTFIYGPENQLLIDLIGPRNWADRELIENAIQGKTID
jgi:thiol-disulfide isomerase/thioredoxin